MATTITIPDFDWAAFYYPELVDALAQYRRVNVPEITDESPYEPFIQFERMTALVGHLNNVLVDLVANESTLVTAKLAETVRNMLALIDYQMRSATPAQTDLVYELSKVFSTSFEVISERAQAATERQGTDPARYFEALAALSITRTDQFSYVLAEEAGAFVDHTVDANNQLAGNDFAPWASPAPGDALYLGHMEAMWGELAFELLVAAANIAGVWEYYDGNFAKTAPSSVADAGGYLDIDLTSYLGVENRAGTVIRVQYNETTAYEDVISTWTGSANVCQTTGYLGQSSPSVNETDYTVGSDWEGLGDVDDKTLDLTVSEKVEFEFPQTVTRNWKTGPVNELAAFWLRYRIIEVSTPTSPTIDYVRMDTGRQYVTRPVTQGRTYTERPFSSTGIADQEFETSKDHYIDGSGIPTVDGEVWEVVENFLASEPGDKHVVISLGENDRASFQFGNGAAGRIPPIGVGNIGFSYRYEADTDGNVGARTITIDKTGLTYVTKTWNPRQAVGWEEAQGASEESLERAKVEGPASLRVKDVALSPTDLPVLARAWTDEDGAAPFGRARPFEGGFGPKTVELTLVAKGGGLATASQLAGLQEHFNGDPYAHPPVEKHFVANQQVVCVNYTPKVIDVVAIVYGKDITVEAIKNLLTVLLHPEAVKSDGITYEWAFGGEVPTSRISAEMFKAGEVRDVTLTTPPANIQLQPRELPIVGTMNIVVVLE